MNRTRTPPLAQQYAHALPCTHLPHIHIFTRAPFADWITADWIRRGRRERSWSAWARCEGIALATRSSYIGAVRAFVKGAHGESLQDPDTLIKYAFQRVDSGNWASHASGTYLTRILAGMKWMRLEVPNVAEAVKMSWLKKAFMRLRTSKGTRHRKPITDSHMKKLKGDLERLLPLSGPAIALSRVAWLGMLRSNELWELSARKVRWKEDSSGGVFIHLRMADKTHLSEERRVVIPVQEHWAVEASALRDRWRARLGTRERRRPLITPEERRAVVTALRTRRRTPGGFRPGGNIFWIHAGLSAAVRHKQGGWAPDSKVPAQHYTRVTKELARRMRRKAGNR